MLAFQKNYEMSGCTNFNFYNGFQNDMITQLGNQSVFIIVLFLTINRQSMNPNIKTIEDPFKTAKIR